METKGSTGVLQRINIVHRPPAVNSGELPARPRRVVTRSRRGGRRTRPTALGPSAASDKQQSGRGLAAEGGAQRWDAAPGGRTHGAGDVGADLARHGRGRPASAPTAVWPNSPTSSRYARCSP
ncbi:hypothetical protein EVAR_86017_1 [Eumeta japonica]|uniref:Uncharacterized protein n=1 Tax=Eumeta variegata TaxID=151549 RepID=A0A4C1UJC2_EUMVA|nr:hypothetical protein EVAR_86017_1 [Eumeta japonica]